MSSVFLMNALHSLPQQGPHCIAVAVYIGLWGSAPHAHALVIGLADVAKYQRRRDVPVAVAAVLVTVAKKTEVKVPLLAAVLVVEVVVARTPDLISKKDP